MSRAVGLLLLAGTSVQFGAAFAVTLFDRLGPGGTVLLRLGFAAAVMVVVMRPVVRGRTRADLRLAVALGLVLGLMNWSFYEALDRLPLGPTVTLEMVGPLELPGANTFDELVHGDIAEKYFSSVSLHLPEHFRIQRSDRLLGEKPFV